MNQYDRGVLVSGILIGGVSLGALMGLAGFPNAILGTPGVIGLWIAIYTAGSTK